MAGEMREAMPTVAAFIDDLRSAFGAEEVNRWIGQGMRSGRFYAAEGDAVIGAPWMEPGVVATVVPEPTVRKR